MAELCHAAKAGNVCGRSDVPQAALTWLVTSTSIHPTPPPPPISMSSFDAPLGASVDLIMTKELQLLQLTSTPVLAFFHNRLSAAPAALLQRNLMSPLKA